MKIVKLKIRNLFGLSEYEYNGSNIELSGRNGVGKTRILDAIKYGLTNRSDREFIISKGEREGEIFIETDTGIKIHRKKRLEQADYRLVKDNDNKPLTEAFIREIFTELQLDPVKFISKDANEQNRIILDLIDFAWDLEWIREQFGEIVPEVNYDDNILNVLYQIQAEFGYYFKKRQDINRDLRIKKAFAEDIGKILPENYNRESWEKVELGAIYKEIETIRSKNDKIEKAKQAVENRDNKVRSFKADLEIEINSIEKAAGVDRINLEKEILRLENRIKECKTELSNLEEKKIGKVILARKSYEAKVAEFEGQVKGFEELAKEPQVSFAELQEKAEHTEKMKEFVHEHRRMVQFQKEAEELNLQSEELTRKIEKARTLPGEILESSNIPIKGITIEDGTVLINGLPLSNISQGEKMRLCISVAKQGKQSLNLLLLDGVETLSTENREDIYNLLKNEGVCFIATRTTDNDTLNVMEL